MQYLDIPDSADTSTLILVHGSWHTGSCWSAVQEQLAEAGIDSRAPTLPGRGGADRALEVRHAGYVSAVLDVLDAVAEPAVLVGHSFGGSVISRVAELRPDRPPPFHPGQSSRLRAPEVIEIEGDPVTCFG